MNLFDALRRITNSTALRMTFQSPLLLIHLASDSIGPTVIAKNASTANLLKRSRNSPYLLCVDTHWEKLQPILSRSLRLEFRPGAKSKEAWHFARHNFAAWDLPDFDLLACVSLSGGTRATIERKRVTFANRPAR